MISKKFKRSLEVYAVLTHRWIGIVTCLLFAVWFISGLVLAYQRFPSLEEPEKLTHLKPIEWSAVKIGPSAAVRSAGETSFPTELRLEMSNGHPVYRLKDSSGTHRAVSATTGALIHDVTPQQAEAIVRDYSNSSRVSLGKANILFDQWAIDPNRLLGVVPLHRVDVSDGAGTSYYVSRQSGEVVLDTNRRERIINYFGAIPHYLYIPALRVNEDLWELVVEIVALTGTVVAICGLWLGIIRLRLRKRYAKGAITPFRGWMKWHHVAGVVGGVAVTTWVATGYLSVYPNGWFEQRAIQGAELSRYAGYGSREFAVDFAAIRKGLEGVNLAKFRSIGGDPFLELYVGPGRPALRAARTGEPFVKSDREVFAAAANLMPDYNIVSTARLEEGDEFWHTGFKTKALPILRVKFDDPMGSWYHIDPATLQIASILDEKGRGYRLVYESLHLLDLHILLRNRPAWDILLWILIAGGLIVSVSGVILGWRRLVFTRDRRARVRQARLEASR